MKTDPLSLSSRILRMVVSCTLTIVVFAVFLALLHMSGRTEVPAVAAVKGSQLWAADTNSGSCSVSGLIGSNATWSPSTCTPYIVTGSVVVSEDVTLTIEPGTVVKFDGLKALNVQGTLLARGTEADPIVFTSNSSSPAPGDWGYIYFSDSSTDAVFDADGNYVNGSIIQHAVVEYAGSTDTYAAVHASSSSPFIDHNTIRNNNVTGIALYHNSVGGTISNNAVSDNAGTGIHVGTQSGAFTISHNTVTNNVSSESGGGIHTRCSISPCRFGATFTIIDNTVTSNTGDTGGGIYVSSYTTLTLSSNTISNNEAWSGGGIYIQGDYGQEVGTISHNAVTNNTANSGACMITTSNHPK